MGDSYCEHFVTGPSSLFYVVFFFPCILYTQFCILNSSLLAQFFIYLFCQTLSISITYNPYISVGWDI